jgi:hypothetical protein
MRRGDPGRVAAVGIACAAAALVGGGLALDLAGALDATGWAVVVAVLAAGGIVAASDPPRRGVPALLALAALGLAIGAVALSRASALDYERETHFTQFWLVPAGTGTSAEIGVLNEEGERTAYRVELYAPASRGGPPLVDEKIVLEPGRSWSRRVAMPSTPLPERVNAELYRGSETESHRSAHVWTRPGA